MQVYYWWFSARERWAARQAREKRGIWRAEEIAAMASGEEHPDRASLEPWCHRENCHKAGARAAANRSCGARADRAVRTQCP